MNTIRPTCCYKHGNELGYDDGESCAGKYDIRCMPGPGKHKFEPKPFADSIAAQYGSELGGDIGNCAVPGCGRDILHDIHNLTKGILTVRQPSRKQTIQSAILAALPIKPVALLEKLCGGQFTDSEVKCELSEMINAGKVEMKSDRTLIDSEQPNKLPQPFPRINKDWTWN